MTVLPYLRLIRFPLVFTAVADVWAGYWIGLPRPEPASWTVLTLLAGVSASFYGLGMALNDLADRKRDTLLHPKRPLATGEVSVASCSWLVVGLSVLGSACLRLLDPPDRTFFTGIALLLTVLAYDLLLKHSLVGASLSMGLCRFLNFYFGCSLYAPARYEPALLVGLFVATITAVSTLEEQSPRAAVWVRRSLFCLIPLDAGLCVLYGRIPEAGIVLSLLLPRLLSARWLPVT